MDGLTPLSRPLGILFDFGDTLLREGAVDDLAGATAVLQHAVDAGGVTPRVLAEALRRLMADLDPRRQSSHLEVPPDTIRRLVYDPLGIRFDIDDADLAWTYWSNSTTWTVTPGVRDVLTTLASAGVPFGVVSNTMFGEATMARQLEASGLGGIVPWIITSGEHVVRKPHPHLFQFAARRLGLPPADIWFVGDSYECDVLGAAGAGMVPIWVCHDGLPSGKIEPAVRAVANWSEFERLLQSTGVLS